MSTPFKMKGFSGFGNKSPLNKNIPVSKGESYSNYLKRAFSQSKDPYGQDVGAKEFYKRSTSGGHHHKHTTGPKATQAPKGAQVKAKNIAPDKRQLQSDAKKTRRLTYKGVKSKITKVAKKLGASDKTIRSVSRGLTTAKQFAKRIPKAGPIGAAITGASLAYPTIKKTAKATVKELKKRAKSGNVNIGRKL